MVRIQAGIAVVAAAGVLVLVPGASACEEPSKERDRERVTGEAGGKVAVDVPNTLEGALWEVRIEDGDEFAHGIDEDPEEGVTAGFEVPDLGEEAREIELLIAVTHEADEARWTYEVELDYRGRPEPEPAEEPAPQPAPEPDPPAEEPAPQPEETQPEPQREADSQVAPAIASTPAPPAPPAAAPAEPMREPDRLLLTPGAADSAPAEPESAATTGLASSQPAAVPAPPVAAERAARRSRRRGARVVPSPPDPSPVDSPRPPRDAPDEGGIRLPDIDVPGFGAGLAWEVIAGGALSFACAGLLLAGVARRRRRDRFALR